MIGYNIFHYSMDITNTHSYTIYLSCVTLCETNAKICETMKQNNETNAKTHYVKQMQKFQLPVLGKYLGGSNYSPKITSYLAGSNYSPKTTS